MARAGRATADELDDLHWGGRALQGVHVPRADDGEVAPVQGGHIGKLQSLSDRDDWGVNRPERQVIVGAHQLSHAEQVCGGDGDVLEFGRR